MRSTACSRGRRRRRPRSHAPRSRHRRRSTPQPAEARAGAAHARVGPGLTCTIVRPRPGAHSMAEDTSHALTEHLDVASRMEGRLPSADAAARAIIDAYGGGGRVYTFGNGGSSADAAHFAEELVGRFKRERRPLPAQSLSVDASALTCIANDYSYDEVFERQVDGFVRDGDVVIGFSTSGRSPNVVRGLAAGRRLGATTVLFAGGA